MNKVSVFLVLLACALGVGGCREQEEKPPQTVVPLPATEVNAKDGAEMVLIPAGEFLMGTSEEELAAWLAAHPTDKREWFTDEMPQHKVYLDAYYMYKTEVTLAQYWKFCEATGRQMAEEPPWKWQDDRPVVNVSWEDATAYAQWAGAALPTEAQWEKAARGGDGRLYPWGNAWPPPAKAGNFADMTMNAQRKFPDRRIIAGYDDGYAETSPVGAFTANPYGLHDMAGNVWEWCADWYDWYDADYYKKAPAKNPTGPGTGYERVFRSGSWGSTNPVLFRAASRSSSDPADRDRRHRVSLCGRPARTLISLGTLALDPLALGRRRAAAAAGRGITGAL